MNLLESALSYANIGWHIFPCQPNSKKPMTKHGCNDASIDPNQICSWWGGQPQANIGLACGNKSGVHVIDIDVKESGENGWESLEILTKEGFIIPATVRQDTPSGGAHFLYRTKDAPHNKNHFKPGIDIRSNGYYIVVTPSIHPNGGQYKWTPGSEPWSIGLAEFPDFMRPQVIEPVWKKEDNVIVPTVTVNDQPFERASAYLAKCDPAVEGQRGHDKLLWAAICMVHGFLLRDEQVLGLLTNEYNPRCDPPWNLSDSRDRKDFERKIQEARKITPTQKPGWLIEDDSYVKPDMDLILKRINVCKLMEEAKAAKVNIIKGPIYCGTSDSEFKFITQPTGLLGRLCSWININAIRQQPIFSLGASLAFCGALFGRKISDEQDLRTNIYCMGLGSSSHGKQWPITAIRKLMSEACVSDLLGGSDIASDTSLEESLANHPSLVFLLDEIGHWFISMQSKSAATYEKRIVPTLMKLYSSADTIYKGKAYADGSKQRMLIQPCLSIWGTSDEKRFREGCTPGQLKDGWLGRCMVFMAHSKPRKQRHNFKKPPSSDLVNEVVTWFSRTVQPIQQVGDVATDVRHRKMMEPMAPTQIIVHTLPEAKEVFYALDRLAEDEGRQNTQFDALWSKVEENAHKVALIVAASESYDNPIITAAVADYSTRLVKYLLYNFIETAGSITENMHEQNRIRVAGIIAEYGISGCNKNELARRTQWAGGKTNRRSMIEDLVEAEIVVEEKVGRSLVYWTIGNYVLHKKTICGKPID